eukprot:m51a1_g13620 putative alpha-galactosidase alpha-n-acetylgalactosaminidase (79) ;mRNA; r:108-473
MAALALALLVAGAWAADDGLARTPPMGWIAWGRYGCETNCLRYPTECVSETLFRSTADALVARGFASLGYKVRLFMTS